MKIILILLWLTCISHADQLILSDDGEERVKSAKAFLPKDMNAGSPVLLDGYKCPAGTVIGKSDFIEDEARGAVYFCIDPKEVEVRCNLDKVDDLGQGYHSAPHDECHYKYGSADSSRDAGKSMGVLSSKKYSGPVSVATYNGHTKGKHGIMISFMEKDGAMVKGTLKNYVNNQ